MQFIDLKAQQKRIRDKIELNINKVLDHGRYIMGPEITELEKKLADYVGVSHAVGVGSGTDALLMGLMAYDTGPGDAIFTSPFTFIATAEVVQLLGATPVFVDIQEDTYNIDPEKLQKEILRIKSEGKLKLKGIIPVDLFGQCADYDEINQIAKEHGMFVLEDAAQSFGATYKNRKACSLTETAATSFFPAKPLGAYGDGGMVFTQKEEIYEKLLSIRIHGQGTNKYDNVRVGINGRIDTIQSAILLAKMDIFQEEVELRQKAATYYSEKLKGVVGTPFIKKDNVSAWAQYSILHPNREQMLEKLKAAAIPFAIYYPIPLHLQAAFSQLGYQRGDFKISERIADQIFSIPMHPYLTPEVQDKILKPILG